VTVQNTTNPDWDEILYLPLCYTTNEIALEVIGQDSLRRNRSIFSNVTPTRNFVKEADGVFIMNERWRQTHTGPGGCSLSTAVSFYPCLTSKHMTKQEDDVSLKSDASFESALEFMPLTSLDDPILSLDGLVKCDTGFIMFKLLSFSARTQSSVSAQLQILVENMLFPSYSSTVARKRGQINKIGHYFIRELEFSQITFRLKKEGDQFDESTEGVLAKLSANTPDILKYCLVCVLTPSLY
jgi:Ca2+-dependent lipid-binding protein